MWEVTKSFRSDLAALNVPDAAKYGLKAFRSGKATQMAADGSTLSSILEYGEWKSAALLRYISETEVDRTRFLHILDREDDEA